MLQPNPAQSQEEPTNDVADPADTTFEVNEFHQDPFFPNRSQGGATGSGWAPPLLPPAGQIFMDSSSDEDSEIFMDSSSDEDADSCAKGNKQSGDRFHVRAVPGYVQSFETIPEPIPVEQVNLRPHFQHDFTLNMFSRGLDDKELIKWGIKNPNGRWKKGFSLDDIPKEHRQSIVERADAVYKLIPKNVRRDEKAIYDFLRGKEGKINRSFSHIKSRKDGGSNDPESGNVLWEDHGLNKARGDSPMTRTEEMSAKFALWLENQKMPLKQASKAALYAAALTAFLQVVPGIVKDILDGKPMKQIWSELKDKFGHVAWNCLKSGGTAFISKFLSFSLGGFAGSFIGVLAVELVVGIYRYVFDTSFDVVDWLKSLGINLVVTIVAVMFPKVALAGMIASTIYAMVPDSVREFLTLDNLKHVLKKVMEFIQKAFPVIAKAALVGLCGASLATDCGMAAGSAVLFGATTFGVLVAVGGAIWGTTVLVQHLKRPNNIHDVVVAELA